MEIFLVSSFCFSCCYECSRAKRNIQWKISVWVQLRKLCENECLEGILISLNRNKSIVFRVFIKHAELDVCFVTYCTDGKWNIHIDSHSSEYSRALIGYTLGFIQRGIVTWKWGWAIMHRSNDPNNTHKMANYHMKCTYFFLSKSVWTKKKWYEKRILP